MGLRGIGAKPVKKAAAKVVQRCATRPGAAGVIRFIEKLQITSGMHAGRPFILRPWQKKIVRAIYAKPRTVRQVLISVARKNGKTQLASALALAHLCGPEARQRGQVYSAAADRNQAAIIMREMIALIRSSPDLADRVIIRSHNKTLEDSVTGSVYQALSSDAKKAHGLSPSFVVCDELAQWRGRELYDALVTGAGAHAESLMVVISTKSPDPNHVMSELVRHGQNILDGTIEAPTFLPIIYAAPQDADPWDEKCWKKSNPALGDFRSLPEMRDTAAMAKRIPAREPAFRLLYLNQPIDQAARFLHRVDWDACRADIDISDLYGKRCILGLDLSATTDLTALTAYFPEGGETLPWFWMPEDKIDEAERRDNAPYRLWARKGNIETTPGKCIDKSFVMHRIGELVRDFNVEACAYDRYQIAELNRLIADEGIKIHMVEWGQGWKDGNAACVAIETAVLQRKLKHPGHPVLDWCVANATTISDPAGNRKLIKDRSTGRIDGIVAASMAVGLAARTPTKKPSVYATRPLIVLGGASA